jgi:hypothetical protein
VGLGLLLVYTGICLMLLGLICVIAAFPLAAGVGNAALAPILLGAAVLMVVVGYILQIVGPLLCLAVPAESGSKGLIIGSVVCMLLSIFGMGLGWFGVQLTKIDPGLSSPTGILGSILFMLFLRQLSLYIGRPDLARRALIVLIGSILVPVLLVGTAFFTIGARFAGGGAAAAGSGSLVIFVLLLAGLVVFIMYANLVNALRKALRP